jgi:hypothetical protein
VTFMEAFQFTGERDTQVGPEVGLTSAFASCVPRGATQQ